MSLPWRSALPSDRIPTPDAPGRGRALAPSPALAFLLALAALPALAALLAGPALAQQRGTQSPNDKRFTTGEELVQLDFKDVELAVVIETIARITGRNFIYDDRVRGRVTIVSPSEVTAEQAFAVFESVLKIKGFTAVPGPGGVLKIVPVRDAKESSIDTIRDDRPSANRDNFVTRLVPLRYIDAEAITNTIKPLVSKDASMVAYAPTNTIILTDTEANIRRLLDILEAIDVESYKEELTVIKVKYADAAVLAEQVSEIYGGEANGASATPAQPTAASSRRRSRSSRRAAASTTTGSSPRDRVRIMTDERTNSLLVLASRGSVEEIRGLVHQLDVPLVGTGRIHVYYLRYADAEELSQTLNGMLQGQGTTQSPGRTGAAGGQPQALRSTVTALAEGITINADPATNSLVIQASKEAYEALVAVIEQLDIERPQVLVEALILEVDVTDNLSFGTEWTINVVNGDQEFIFSTAQAAGGGGGPAIAGVIQRAVQRDEDGNPLSPADAGGPNDGTDVNAVLKAAAQDGNLNIVSSPHILTSDNEEAEIRIGNNIPIITSRVNSATGNTAGLATSVNVERQDIGVTLRVTPQISEGDSLRLKIFQELTDVNTELQDDVGSPEEVGVSLFNRKVENTVVVKDSETVVIGGLISDRWIDGVRKVPYLGDIPGLGWAFKSTDKSLRKINLLIFLTPHIVRSADELELQTIRKRGEFEKDSGDIYQTDEETLRKLDRDEGDWAPGKAPVLGALRKHAVRYPPSRGLELEELQREAEAQRIADRLADETGTAYRYGVRVAVFRDPERAAAALTQMLDAGYEGALYSGDSEGTLIYELLVGPYEDLESAGDAANVIEEIYGYTPNVTVIEISTRDEDAVDSGEDVEP